MIDLHTHTTESDGSLTPHDLVLGARQAGLEAVGITDHDTFSGYDLAVDFAKELGVEVICGIELTTKFHGRSVHLLGYFLNCGPSEEFRHWVGELQKSRHARNAVLVERLRSRGMKITLEEVHQRGGKLPGRPHFAMLLSDKGYACSAQQAFELYLGETSACFVPREEVPFAESVRRIAAAGGLSSLAHPLRITDQLQKIEDCVRIMKEEGLDGVEVYHSDHSTEDTDFLASLATRLLLAFTGGSDFHGESKPGVQLGTSGRGGRVYLPYSLLDELRRISGIGKEPA